MLISIALVLIAFLWLLIETQDLSVNLCGKPKSKTLLLSAGPIILALPAPKVEFDAIERPYSWKTADQKHDSLILCLNNYNCAYRAKCKKTERWIGWKIPARKLTAFGSTLNLNSQCNIARALLLRDMAQAQKPKVKHTIIAPFNNPIKPVEVVRAGSHWDKRQWQDHNGKKHVQNNIVEDYETVFHDTLVPKSWLEAHHKDELPEQSIEISVGEKSINVNGNYEPKMIEQFMSQFTYKARAGKKVINVCKGDVVVNCGGGVYVTQPEN